MNEDRIKAKWAKYEEMSEGDCDQFRMTVDRYHSSVTQATIITTYTVNEHDSGVRFVGPLIDANSFDGGHVPALRIHASPILVLASNNAV